MKVSLRMFWICFVFLFYVDFAFALIISEIQFDPSGTDTDREWVEVFNNETGPVDFTTYKFFENNTNHGLEVALGDKNLLSGEYAVIIQDLAKFKLDFPSYTGKLFKSSFSLSNTGEILSLKDKDLNVIYSLNYTPADTGAGNGLTINTTSTGFEKSNATPGVGGLTVGASYALGSNTTGTSTSSSTSTTTMGVSTTTISDLSGFVSPVYYHRSYWPESEKVYVHAGENKLALSGAEVLFQVGAMTGDKKNIPDNDANFFWSFGDGSEAQGKNPRHEYKFPGEYVVNVEAYANGNKGEDKIYIKVSEPDLKIKIVEIDKQGEIEIFNNSNSEISLNGLVISGSVSSTSLTKSSFNLSKKLSILPKKAIILDRELFNFATGTDQLSLGFPNGKIISKFVGVGQLSLKKISKDNLSEIAASTDTNVKVYTKEDFEKSKNQVGGSNLEVLPKTKSFTIKKSASAQVKKEVRLDESKSESKEAVNKYVIRKEESVTQKLLNFLGL